MFLRRKSVYYAFDSTTKTFQSLKTKDDGEANRLLVALNEAGKQPAMNLGLARVYLKHSDPMVSQRTWQHTLDEIIKLKSGPTQYRWQTAAKDKAFDLIRDRLLIETQAARSEVHVRRAVTEQRQDSSSQADIADALRNSAAAAPGGDQSLALRSNGTVVAWGSSPYGQTNPPSPGLGKSYGEAQRYCTVW